MIPYFLLLLFLLILQLHYTKYHVTNLKFSIAMITLFFFAAFRGNGNGDYFTYIARGETITSIDDLVNNKVYMEIGFRAIAFIVNYLGLHSQFTIAAMNLISILCITILINKYSTNKILSLLIFLPIFFQYDMHAARAAVAISITTMSLKFSLTKQPIKFVITIFLAMCFHQSALIAIFIYFIDRIPYKKIFHIFTIMITYLIASVTGFDFWIYKVLNALGLQYISAKYKGYMDNERFGYAFSLLDPRLLLLFFVFAIAIYVTKNPDRFLRMMINICWANILLIIIFSEHTIFVTRLSAYYNIYSIIFVPILLEKLKNNYLINCKLIGFYDNKFYIKNLFFIDVIYVLFIIATIYSCFIKSDTIYRLFFA